MVEHDTQPPVTAQYPRMPATSGCTCLAPSAITGLPSAAATHSRAAEANPVLWASIPLMAVS